MNEDRPLASFDEVRAVLAELPGPDQAAAAAAAAREGQLTKPAGALGRIEELAAWLAAWQGRHPPRIERAQTAVFAGNHGVAAQGVSAYPAEVTKQMVANFLAGGAAVNQLCGVADSGLRVYEMGLEQPTEDFSQGPAMDEAGCAGAIAYGMMAVEEGLDVIALGEMGIANTTSAAALCQALYGGSAADWVGRGTGVDDAGLDRKTQVIEAAVVKHRAAMDRPARGAAPSGAASSWRRSWARCWPRAWRARRCCSTAIPAPPRPRCCTRSTPWPSTTARSPTSRSSRATGACSSAWTRSRCWTSACAWARPPARY